jgi:class 3 adenylate cyclase
MPNYPSGTVTFLFTDIEGSTALWEGDRQAMAAAVERHLTLLRTAIEVHGGVLFKTVGDAVQAAFPTAPDAVAAAVQGQQALLAEDWKMVGTLQVRMALHAGEAIPDERGDYLAAPLNRLSRLLLAGHGGQILLTQTVQQLARSALADGIETCWSRSGSSSCSILIFLPTFLQSRPWRRNLQSSAPADSVCWPRGSSGSDRRPAQSRCCTAADHHWAGWRR